MKTNGKVSLPAVVRKVWLHSCILSYHRKTFLIYHLKQCQTIWNLHPILGRTLISGQFRSKVLLCWNPETHNSEIILVSGPDHREASKLLDILAFPSVLSFIYIASYCIGSCFFVCLFVSVHNKSSQANRNLLAHAEYSSAWQTLDRDFSLIENF